MCKFEKKTAEWIQKYYIYILAAIVTVLAFFARTTLFPQNTSDMNLCLIPWFNQIKEGGGINALGRQIGNYGIPYQTILAILSYLPFEPIVSIKLFSCIFDYVFAVSIAKLCGLLFDDDNKTILGYVLILVSPIVIINSAAWGQCDSIYASFCVFSIYYYLKGNPILTFVMLGLAFSFKLQAIFLLPVFVALYFLRKDFSFLHVLITPVVMVLMSLAGIIKGRPFFAIFTEYMGQTGAYADRVSLNYPGLFGLVSIYGNDDMVYYTKAFTSVAFLILGVALFFMIRKENKPTKGEIVDNFFLGIFFTVLILPGMHERYGYIYEALCIPVMMRHKKMIPVCVGLLSITVMTYSNYLFRFEHMLDWISVLNIALFIAGCIIIYNDNKKPENVKGNK